MGVIQKAAGVIVGVTFLWAAGCKVIRDSAGKREMACYTGLMMWCAYILLADLFNWIPLTTAMFRESIYYPLGYWLKRALLGSE